MSFEIRRALPADAQILYEMIVELADFEESIDQVDSSPSVLMSQIAEPSPPFECLIASANGVAIGFALFFYSYSTWRAKKGIWLEDLYVRETHRGQGVGSLLFDTVKAIAEAESAGRLEWAVLEWNTKAHEFYLAKGAQPLTEWRTWRVSL